jgi:cytidine deaminase
VIATKTGEILSTGCNEVPRAGGGVIWDDVAGTSNDYRDWKLGQDAAAGTKKVIVGELLEKLAGAGWLMEDKKKLDTEERANQALYSEAKPLAGTMVASLLEFGRIVHAEMAAICDSAMRGVSIRGATLYCTTFPCHMCARHILASGINRVVYIEPYPKSQAKKLYKRTIRVDHDREADENALTLEAFVGVAPTRFLDLFEMVDRKDDNGYALPETPTDKYPKGVTLGSLASEHESTYLEQVNSAIWSDLDVEGIKKSYAAG